MEKSLLTLAVVMGSLMQWVRAPGPPTSQGTPIILVDVSAAEDLKPFADEAREVCRRMYPIIARELASDGFTPPRVVTIIFKEEDRFPAATAGDRIFCSAKWFRDHPDDVGAIVHELAHVIQSYPKYDPPWLVEGIADYVRFYRYEPGSQRPSPDPKKAKYTDGYRTTAAFLAWIEEQHDPKIVVRLNAACREGRYRPELFETFTGKPLDELWAQYLQALSAHPRAGTRAN